MVVDIERKIAMNDSITARSRPALTPVTRMSQSGANNKILSLRVSSPCINGECHAYELCLMVFCAVLVFV